MKDLVTITCFDRAIQRELAKQMTIRVKMYN
jgi:hypothetical protein